MSADQIQFSIIAERSVIRNDQPSEIEIAAEVITAKSLESNKEKFALNLCIVIDRSGSMEGEKLEQAKQACINVYESLNANDKFTVLAFDDDVISVVNPQTPKQFIRERIQAIEIGGSTNLSKGWYLGLLELQTYSTDHHINRLMLLSDGQATGGEQKISVLEAESSNARDNLGIITTTIGIGADFQEDILAAIARASGGRFWFIGEARVEDIIKEEFSGALSVLIERPGVQFELPDGAKVTKELNDFPRNAGRYRLRPIKGNDQIGIAVRLEIDPDRHPEGHVTLAATLFDGAGVVQKSELRVPIGTVEDFVRSPEDARVAAIVSMYRAALSSEKVLARIDAKDVSGMLEMVQNESEFLKELHAKLEGAVPTSWESMDDERRAAREHRLAELQMEIAENDTLAAVAELINLMKGLGLQSEIDLLTGGARKMFRQKGSRGFSGHSRSGMEDWAPVDLLSTATSVVGQLIVQFPNLKTELVTLQGRIDDSLAKFS